MILSKNLSPTKCRRCAICLARQYNSSTNANTENSLHGKGALGLGRMALNQWKVVTQLRDQLNKSSLDRASVMFVVNREWINILKKLPSITGQVPKSDSLLHTNSTSTNQTSIVNTVSNSISELPTVLHDLKSRFYQKSSATNQTPKPGPVEPLKWKVNKRDVVSDVSIKARTKYLLQSVETADSPFTLINRLESLIAHFLQYPDSVSAAIKLGAIRSLLTLRESSKYHEDISVRSILKEALTILGYTDPPKNRGIRILAIDGGGIRGLLALEMIQKLEDLTGKKIGELFDYVCGVSTGSILLCGFTASGRSIQDCSKLYKDLSHRIFTQNAFYGAKALLWSHGYYDTALWEEMLLENLGDKLLIHTARDQNCPKIGAISAVIVQDQVIPFIFRNYELPFRVHSPYLGSSKHKVWEAARASAAAPTYFEEFRLGNLLHQDGGICVNNPTAVAIHEAKQLWPEHSIQCVVSLGTGRTWPIPRSDMTDADTEKELNKQASWKEKFYQILVSATDTEAVHTMLNDLLPPSVYFRFNPYLTEMLSMVEFQPEKLRTLEQDALMYIRRNEDKFQEAAAALTQPKPKMQGAKEWLALQSLVLGFK